MRKGLSHQGNGSTFLKEANTLIAFLGLCLAIAVYIKDPRLYFGFLWSRNYHFIILAALLAAFCLLVIRWIFRHQIFYKTKRLIFGIVFLPLLLFPLIRCYFKVPYVFCRVCPNQCPWGISRMFVFSGFVLLNLFGKFWCTGLCPFRTIQEWQAQILKRNPKLLSYLNLSVYVMLGLAFAAYLLTLYDPASALAYFGVGVYRWSVATSAILFLIIIAGFFIPKLFCRYVCPVGAIEVLTTAAKLKLRK